LITEAKVWARKCENSQVGSKGGKIYY
jgi:hypothetical protein